MVDLKNALEEAWENGFFFNLRYGKFKEDQYQKLRTVFEAVPSNVDLDKRLVSLLWFIPTFIQWQEERLLQAGMEKGKINEVYDFFYNECEAILGLP
jgi:hypothetical protein